jgi:starch synthase (maltosyl-transferring)
VVEGVEPLVDDGRFSAKGIAGDSIDVSADVFSHGHDLVRAWVRHRPVGARKWHDSAMVHLGNDRFAGAFVADEPGAYEVEVVGDLDELATWHRDAIRRLEAGRPDPHDPQTGALLIDRAASELASARLKEEAEIARDIARRANDKLDAALLVEIEESAGLFRRRPVPPSPQVAVRARFEVARERAGFSSWYEMFPRSASPDPTRPGTLRDVIERLDYVAALGFDVLYLPPIHPIGTTARKGKGNSPVAGEDDVGSPWAIGSVDGGHTAIAPELGSLDDFEDLLEAASARGIEVALDLAFQCSPDHPWVTEHPQWFRHRPDGTIACAENPPKRYEDIYPIDFASEDREALWQALLEVTLFWVDRGVRIFRVDNPHTKPFPFWEWMLGEVKREHPDVIFLSEAFTRPKVMNRLAKLGFDQSYTYFTWRDSKWELREYFESLTRGPEAFFFRPNVWPNTPDILAHSLAVGGRPAFITRLVLAAGLASNYGIYGPAFELLANEPAAPGSEEYFASEKYEVRHHDLADPRGIAWLVARVNAARHEHRALQRNRNLRFHPVDNDQILCWSKHDDVGDDVMIGIVSLDPQWPQSGIVDLDLGALGLRPDAPFVIRDLLGDSAYVWAGPRNFVRLDPAGVPAHLLAVERL